jgi:phage repressor protein C with HTH and peptisase S24 domain
MQVFLLNTFMETKDVLKKIRKDNGLTQAEFAKSIGTSGVNYGHIENGRQFPTIEILRLAAKKYKISYDYLIDGTPNTYKENQLTTIASEPAPKYGNPKNKGIPLIPIDALAGLGNGDGLTVHDFEVEEWYNVPDLKKADFMIRVKGDSMTPRYKAGDIVGCLRQNKGGFIQWNEIYVLDTTQGVLLKRIRKGRSISTWILHSENPDYDDIEIDSDEVRHFSLVVGGVVLE